MGQNFLNSEEWAEKIVGCADLSEQDVAIEIGPGFGALTKFISGKVKKVICIEKDRRLCLSLSELFSDFKNIALIHADFLRFSLAEEAKRSGVRKFPVLGNLPYSVTSPIINHLLGERHFIKKALITLQEEVARRLIASPGTKDYGRISIFCQFYSIPRILLKIPKDVFYPSPRVNSCLIRLDIRDAPPVEVEDRALFFEVVRASFETRRKTIANALLHACEKRVDKALSLKGIGRPTCSRKGIPADKTKIKEILGKAKIDPSRRGETLSMKEFAAISNIITHNLYERAQRI